MLDYFALLNEPRRPWLEPESLKQKFLALSATVHPDRVHNASAADQRAAQDRYTALHAAYQCLRDPKERLQHLLELELGAKPQQVQRIAPELMNLFFQVGQLGRDADTFLAEKAQTTSPLLQVQAFKRGQEWAEKLTALRQQLEAWQAELAVELKTLDARWNAAGTPDSPDRRALLPRLEELYRLFGYCGRWHSQLQERIVQLAL